MHVAPLWNIQPSMLYITLDRCDNLPKLPHAHTHTHNDELNPIVSWTLHNANRTLLAPKKLICNRSPLIRPTTCNRLHMIQLEWLDSMHRVWRGLPYRWLNRLHVFVFDVSMFMCTIEYINSSVDIHFNKSSHIIVIHVCLTRLCPFPFANDRFCHQVMRSLLMWEHICDAAPTNSQTYTYTLEHQERELE